MLDALEIQALRADLGAVGCLLQGRCENDDPIGHRQLSQRYARLEAELKAVETSRPRLTSPESPSLDPPARR